ncbi:protein FAR1-RELATED SEQUENCE 5-like [Senna tora]|uniref:Protein FAR1-RELATED SEQUENCE 5-like n=1 Tax=Senna tora TaxID=362788 RepID=A0A834SSD2_9FABA|nr:protein FAR1-RELATED SEQUENCE 5-like [Senna tora]
MGMEFDTIEEAWKFWGEYGRRIGFGVILTMKFHHLNV